MKTLKENLEIMLYDLENHQTHYFDGLCTLAGYSIEKRQMVDFNNEINVELYLEERGMVIDYIHANRPMNFRTLRRDVYYWKRGEKTPRIKWLKKHIKKLTK